MLNRLYTGIFFNFAPIVFRQNNSVLNKLQGMFHLLDIIGTVVLHCLEP
jgi:hypothetical protein